MTTFRSSSASASSSRWVRLVTLALAAVSLALVAVACEDDGGSNSPRIAYGPSLALGQGTARTFVSLDNQGAPTKLGVALSESAMQGLPTTPMPGMPSAVMLTLALPSEASNTGFDHVMLDWNPAGHEPDHVYTHPHFDFHFYQITSAERDAIVPSNPTYAAKVGVFPSPDFVPAGFVAGNVLAGVPAVAAAVPFMGMHWLDVTSPELQPPPSGKTFTTTFIYGSYDGKFTFLEPMITKAYIESMKDKADGVTMPIGVAAKVAKTGAYPNAYSIKYDAASKEYRITLEGLTQRLQ
jgi:Domain of unknown function (DUF5602)